MDVPGPDTTSTTITGLTLGTPYRFTVAPLNVTGPGSPSNQVLATPLGDVGPPTPTATGGDSSAQVFWTEPTLSGRPGPPSYFVMYRPTGTTTWIAGPGPLSARTTSIPGLTNGTTYDVGVFATSTDGTASTLATTTVTPVGPPGGPDAHRHSRRTWHRSDRLVVDETGRWRLPDHQLSGAVPYDGIGHLDRLLRKRSRDTPDGHRVAARHALSVRGRCGQRERRWSVECVR